MYVDPSRIADLVYLQQALDNPRVPAGDKKRAYRSQQKILRELHDPELAAMRERLVKAVHASDKYEAWKITNQIKEYKGEDKLEEGTM